MLARIRSPAISGDNTVSGSVSYEKDMGRNAGGIDFHMLRADAEDDTARSSQRACLPGELIEGDIAS